MLEFDDFDCLGTCRFLSLEFPEDEMGREVRTGVYTVTYFCVGTCCPADKGTISCADHAHDSNQYIPRVRHTLCVIEKDVRRVTGDLECCGWSISNPASQRYRATTVIGTRHSGPVRVIISVA